MPLGFPIWETWFLRCFQVMCSLDITDYVGTRFSTYRERTCTGHELSTKRRDSAYLQLSYLYSNTTRYSPYLMRLAYSLTTIPLQSHQHTNALCVTSIFKWNSGATLLVHGKTEPTVVGVRCFWPIGSLLARAPVVARTEQWETSVAHVGQCLNRKS